MARTRSARLGLPAAALVTLVTVGACASTTPSASTPAPPSTASATAATGGSATQPPSSAASSGAPQTKESSPTGDIPDNQAFVAYTPAKAGFTVKVPEGWARTDLAEGASFSDRLNGIVVQSRPATKPATAADVQQQPKPGVETSLSNYRLSSAKDVKIPAGPAVQAMYTASAPPDQVTGKTVQDEVLVYTISGPGKQAVLALVAPKGADNVDPWKIVSDSFRWTR